MKITHVLKDGTITNTVENHIVKKSEVQVIYELMDSISERISHEKDNNQIKSAGDDNRNSFSGIDYSNVQH